MKETTSGIQIKDLPDELIARIQMEIEPYEVILLDPNITEDDVPLMASGTLVQIEDQYGILTAKHVTAELKKLREIGINLGTFEHRFTIDTSALRMLESDGVAQEASDSDLAVIILPVTEKGAINAKKVFWNLTKRKQSVFERPIDWRTGLFFLCGSVGEWARIEESDGQFGMILDCRCEFMYTGVRQYYLKGQFDYLDLGVSYRNRTDLPDSYRGASGGGIWGTQLRGTENGGIAYSVPLLVGMAFKQDVQTSGSRSLITGITGYGPRSIYEQVASRILLD